MSAQHSTNTTAGYVRDLVERLRKNQMTIATVESCTGGMLASLFTQQAGVSDVYLGGYVTYSNELKVHAVGVDPVCIEQFGAVSPQTAIQMAQGGCANTKASIAISLTGIAGPDGGTADKPVGTVWMCAQYTSKSLTDCRCFRFQGDRVSIQKAACRAAIRLINSVIDRHSDVIEFEIEQWKRDSV